jgi:hypothetical protein
MLMPVSATSGDDYNFPISMNDTVPSIGQSFDLVNGVAGQVVALDSLTSGQFDVVPLKAGGSTYFYVYDADSFSDAFSFSMQAGGGGWGASYGMAASASALLKTSSLSQSIHFRGVKQQQQSVVKPNAALSAEATEVLKQDVPTFVKKYGTHFVAGYVYGQRCTLSYNMNFSSLAFASQFFASFNESTSELGFSDSMQAAINNALQKSSSQCQYTVDSDTRGFISDAPSSITELATVLSQYNAASNVDTPILLIIRPWTYLEAVDGAFGLPTNNYLSQLAKLMNKYVFIQQTCQNFIDSSLFAGTTQLTNLKSTGKKAGTAADAITARLDQLNAEGQPATQSDVDDIAYASPESLLDRMNNELARFWLAIAGSTGSPDIVKPANELAQQKSSVTVSTDKLSLQTKESGVYFDWSQPAVHGIFTINDGGNDFYVGTMGFNLDADQGTLKMWWRTNTGDMTYSDPKKIRGIDTALGPSDPLNNDRLAWNSPGTSIRLAICPD